MASQARKVSGRKESHHSSHRKKRDPINIGSIVGGATGEADGDVVPGGWTGTDDATSTAPSDLPDISRNPSGLETSPDIDREGDDLGNFSDLPETPMGDDQVMPMEPDTK